MDAVVGNFLKLKRAVARCAAPLLVMVFAITLPQALWASSRTDLNLVIAVDCSWSVNSEEFALQAGGIATAFSDPEVMAAIAAGNHKKIAITIFHWSTASTQATAIPWTVIETAGDAIAVANAAASMKRLTANGGTSIAGALKYGQNALNTAPVASDRHIIDVIADGENNNGERVETVRDSLIKLGTTINGLAVKNEVFYLHHYLRNRVIGGADAFVEETASYADFHRAFKRKLLREIKGNNLVHNHDQQLPSINSPVILIAE